MRPFTSKITRNRLADRTNGRANRRAGGQGMVEFALILPLLLLLVFGIIEVGRLLYVYSSVQAASREAGRYASAAGEVSTGLPYYLDASGIQSAAKRISVMVPINSVAITYDHGPHTSTFTPAKAGDIKLRDRVTVAVTASYNPLLGLTPLRPFNITAETSRTIIKEVPVGVSSTGGNNDTPIVTINAPADGAVYSEGEMITFSATANDTEDGNLTSSLTWYADDTQIGTGGSFSLSTLGPGPHIIVVQVSDSSNSTGSATVTITVNLNLPPTVTIIKPVNGSSYEQGAGILFQGTAIDLKDGDLSASLKWSSTVDGALGTGAWFSLNNLSIGTHVITAKATDSNGQVGSAQVIIAVTANTPPTIQITSPGDGSQVAHSQTIRFTGIASDAVDGNLSNSIVWTSSINGALGIGSSIDVSGQNLTTGTHTITARVTDSNGNVAQASITIYVLDGTPPTLIIWASPTSSPGSPQYTYEKGLSITFSGSATDTKDGDISASIRWFLDGTQVNTGAAYGCHTNTLALGPHTLIARVKDSENLEVSDGLTFVLAVNNTPPTITILKPGTPGPFKTTVGINFQGSASDAQDGDLSSSIQWTSSLSGLIGSGANITHTLSVAGTHLITATVTDSGGLTASATVSIQVEAPICPQQGTYIFYKANNSAAATRRSLVWSPTVTGITGSGVPLKLLNLQLTLNNTQTGVSTNVQILTTNYAATRTGSVLTLDSQPTITVMNNGPVGITFTFLSPYVQAADGPFTALATFEGCDTIQILADVLNATK